LDRIPQGLGCVVTHKITIAVSSTVRTSNLMQSSCLGGAVVSVLPTGPKIAGSNPAKVMDF
jgi:hypothetical protein